MGGNPPWEWVDDDRFAPTRLSCSRAVQTYSPSNSRRRSSEIISDSGDDDLAADSKRR